MKKVIFAGLISMLLLLINPSESRSQVVVPQKPVPPVERIKTPPSPGSGYVLIPAHWMWHRPTKTYVWVGPVWVPAKPGKIWVPGEWRQVKNGWKWIPGYWKKEPPKFAMFS